MSPIHDGIVGPVPEGRDPEPYDRLRRRVLWSLTNGLYVLGSCAGERRNLMTISLVTQVATAPKLVAASVESTAVTHGLISESGFFALSLLPRGERAAIRRFVKPVTEVDVDERGIGTMQGEAVVVAPSGAPVLGAAAAWLDCRVRHQVDLGSHTLFVGEVTDCGFGRPGEGGPDDEQSAPDGGLLRMEDTRMNYGG